MLVLRLNKPSFADRKIVLLSAVSILARTSTSSIMSGLVTSCAAALAFISYQR